jgi:hypothetical protein
MFDSQRASSERRSGKDRRRTFSLQRFLYKGSERRVQKDRRSRQERRDGWIRIDRWSSVKMRDLKLAKYLHPR